MIVSESGGSKTAKPPEVRKAMADFRRAMAKANRSRVERLEPPKAPPRPRPRTVERPAPGRPEKTVAFSYREKPGPVAKRLAAPVLAREQFEAVRPSGDYRTYLGTVARRRGLTLRQLADMLTEKTYGLPAERFRQEGVSPGPSRVRVVSPREAGRARTAGFVGAVAPEASWLASYRPKPAAPRETSLAEQIRLGNRGPQVKPATGAQAAATAALPEPTRDELIRRSAESAVDRYVAPLIPESPSKTKMLELLLSRSVLPSPWATKVVPGGFTSGEALEASLAPRLEDASLPVRWLNQAAQILPGMAFGLYEGGKAVAQDITSDEWGSPFPRTRAYGEDIGRGIVEQFKDPIENLPLVAAVGYGGLSSLGSSLARGGAAFRALRAGGDVGTAMRVAANPWRPREVFGGKPAIAGTYPLRLGEGQVDVLLSRNPVARTVQKGINRRRQAKLDAWPREQTGLQEIAHRRGINLSPEAKVGREVRAARRVEEALTAAPIIEQQRLVGNAFQRTRGIRLLAGTRRGLSAGEHAAIYILSHEGKGAFDNPAAVVQRYIAQHQKWLQEGHGKAVDQRVMVAAFKLAQPVLERPRGRFVEALEATRGLSRGSEEARITLDLITEAGARARTAKPAALYRGEEFVSEMGASLRVPESAGGADVRATVAERLAGLGATPKEAAMLADVAVSRAGEGWQAVYDAVGKYTRSGKPGESGLFAHADPYSGTRRGAFGRVAADTVRADAASPTAAPGLTPEYLASAETQLARAMGTLAKAEARHAKSGRTAEPGYLRGARSQVEQWEAVVSEARSAQPVLSELTPPEGAFYSRAGLRKGKVRTTYTGTNAGELGMPVPFVSRYAPEVSHEYTGASTMAGATRLDVANVVAEQAASTARLRGAIDLHGMMERFGSPTRRASDDVFIRSVKTLTPEEKRALQATEQPIPIGKTEALFDAEYEALYNLLNPKTEGEIAALKGKGVWVPKDVYEALRVIAAPNKAADTFQKVVGSVTNPIRVMHLFAKGGYILNLPGTMSMLAMTQGGRGMQAALLKAWRAGSVYGKDTAALIDAAAGAGISLSLGGETRGFLSRGTRALARAWTVVVDRSGRRASLIAEMERFGIKTPEQVREFLTTPSAMRTEAIRRAKKAIGEYDNLTPVEKDFVRHVVYFYPWFSRATVWAGRTAIENPVKTAALAEIGAKGAQDLDEILGPRPAWARRAGVFPADGRLVNPQSILAYNSVSDVGESLFALGYNALQTLGVPVNEQLGEALNAGRAADVITPGMELLFGMFGGADRSQGSLLESLPQYQLGKRIGWWDQTDLSGKPPQERPVYSGRGGWQGLGPFLAGGVFPREYDKEALRARGEEEELAKLTPVQRRLRAHGEFRTGLLHAARQAGFDEKKLPAEIREAITWRAKRAAGYAAAEKKLDRALSQYEALEVEVRLLTRAKRLPPAEARAMLAEFKTAPSEAVEAFRRELAPLFGADALSEFRGLLREAGVEVPDYPQVRRSS